MDSIKLIATIAYINLRLLNKGDVITMIEFEDGGGYKFNYKTMYLGAKAEFIDLTGKI